MDKAGACIRRLKSLRIPGLCIGYFGGEELLASFSLDIKLAVKEGSKPVR